TVFYPGAFALFVLLALLLERAPWGLRIRGPAGVALGALVLIAVWTLLSFFWTPSHDAAIEDSLHALLYATSFALGLWLVRLLGRRMELAVLPVTVAAAVVGVGTVATLCFGTDITNYLDGDGTLQFPLGYRNAAAAYFLIALWPALALAAGERF